jgi:hypothetical protein
MGRDKGKFNKRGGRGSTHFQATSAEEIEQRNSRIAELDEQRSKRRAEADDAEGGGGGEEKDVADAAKKVASLNVAENPNRDAEEKPMTRKQREQADRERKAAEYRRRHELGLTDEYKRDMEKLAEVKRRREASQKKAAEAKEAEEAQETDRLSQLARATAAAAAESDSDEEDDKKKKKKSKKKVSIPKLDKIVIKKMKPTALKEALKERGLEIQGNAKALTARLLKFEAER